MESTIGNVKPLLMEQTVQDAINTLTKQGYVEIKNSGFSPGTYKFKHNDLVKDSTGNYVKPENGQYISVVEIPGRVISIVTTEPYEGNISSRMSVDENGKLYYSGFGSSDLSIHKVFEKK
jgi:hypothetical protein